MLARTRPSLPAAGLPPHTSAEQKVDGYRLICFAHRDRTVLQSRRGSDLAAAFPELAAAGSALGRPLVLDGELVVPRTGRLDFALLQQRARRRGRSAAEAAQAHPAYMIVFDLLESAGTTLLHQPYRERRALLEELFRDGVLPTGAGQFALCPATEDPAQARAWMDPAWGSVGIEGLVLKRHQQPYLPGERAWEKVRARASDEGIVGGVTGTLRAPSQLLLGRYDTSGGLRLVARTTPLARPARRELAPLLEPADQSHPWHGVRFSAGWGSREDLDYQPVQPRVVAEFLADTAVDAGRYRHPVRFLRVRSEIDPAEVTKFAGYRRSGSGGSS